MHRVPPWEVGQDLRKQPALSGNRTWSPVVNLAHSQQTATMTRFSVIVLATLVGAGITGAASVLSAQNPSDAAPGPVGAQPTISSDAATAWQGLRRRPKQTDPVPQEQAVVQSGSFRPSMPVQITAPPQNATSLARSLQRELKRAGCYHGEINGIWSTSTRQAMKAYTDRANAKLPVTQPDPVLLALIQGDQHLGCTASPPNSKSIATSEQPAGEILEPPMALAGPKTSASEGKTLNPDEPVQKAKRRHNADRPARPEHWTKRLWKDSTY